MVLESYEQLINHILLVNVASDKQFNDDNFMKTFS